MMDRLLIILSASVLLGACGEKELQLGPEALIELELVDSLVVDETSTLAIDDYSKDNGYFLIKGTRTRKPYLVDENGLIIEEYNILNDGPNGVGINGGYGYRFLDKDRWVAQGIYNGYHLYNLKGKKTGSVPHNHVGLFGRTVYAFRTTFNPYVKNGIPYVLGEEPNSFDPAKIDADQIGAGFYQEARTIYNYNLETRENELLETYPPEWTPRKKQRFVGLSHPFVAYRRNSQEMILLPTSGNQLFVYDYSDSLPKLKQVVSLSHRFRPKEVPLVKSKDPTNYSDYPKFTDLRILGEYILVGFHTKIPEEIMQEFRAKSESYHSLPAYKTAQEQYNKPYYLLVKDGKQVGVLEEFPVHGTLDFTDEEGFLYINDNVSPKAERGYNVFFKLKIKE